ncbi:sensor histidine kinase [Deinococcus sp. VB343]|uniref:sensor histidine kinase n=1 Tax=Deinococcus sp. VB343 TaxID=3385567 RepID=UPI0039C9133F
MASLLVRPLLLPLLVLALVTLGIVTSFNLSAASAHYADNSQARLLRLRLMLTDIAQMENGQRGYVITGRESALRPYLEAQQGFERHVREYRELIITERQHTRIDRVVALVERWEREAAQPEIAARRESLDAAVARIAGGRGEKLSGEARAVLLAMLEAENERLTGALRSSNQSLLRVRWLTPLGLLLCLALLALALRRAIETLEANIEQLTGGTRQIAAGEYGQRLTPLGIREFDLLGQQFNRMAATIEQRQRELEARSLTLQQVNESLQRSNHELERFAYVASHDLQEPLRTIGSYTELIAKRYGDKLDERGERYIEFTISATYRLKNLIQDLLVFSRARRTGREFGPVDMNALLGEVAGDLETRLSEVGGQLEVGPLPHVQGNPELLHHIFLNLLGNALKFRDPRRPPHVGVRAEPEGEMWRFSVQDNGIGIEAEYHERIFEIFQRLHGVGEYEGSGIGLAVTRSAVEQHGGRIWLVSEPGQGTTFFFTLPSAVKPQTEQAT